MNKSDKFTNTVSYPRSVNVPSWVQNELNSSTGKGVRVAVLDSGWDYLLNNSNIKNGVGFVDPLDDLQIAHTKDFQDRIGHGTACTSIILSLSPDVEIYPVKVFGKQLETSTVTLETAIRWAANQNIHIIHLSLGTIREEAVRPFYIACEYAKQKGSIVVAAANITTFWSYPAVFDNVISVTVGDFKSDFDYEYFENEAVECKAKGKHNVRWLGGQRKLVIGSSFAAPCISGIIALFLERYRYAKLEKVRKLLVRYSNNNEILRF